MHLHEVFHSDNVTEFKNKALDKFLEERGVTHTTIPPYHAQANSVKRVDRTIKTMITSFLQDNHCDWDSHVPELTYAYNTVGQVDRCEPSFPKSGQATGAFNFFTTPRRGRRGRTGGISINQPLAHPHAQSAGRATNSLNCAEATSVIL